MEPSSCIPEGSDWFSLLGTLMEKQDGASNQATYTNKHCRFTQLPVHSQRTILGHISHHALEIPLPLLQKFVREVQDCKLSDHWCLFHLHALQNHIAAHMPGNSGQSSNFLMGNLGQITNMGALDSGSKVMPMTFADKSEVIHDAEQCGWPSFVFNLQENLDFKSKLGNRGQRSKVDQFNGDQSSKFIPGRAGFISERSKDLFSDVCKSVNENSDVKKRHQNLKTESSQNSTDDGDGQEKIENKSANIEEIVQNLSPLYSGMNCFIEYFTSHRKQEFDDYRTEQDVRFTIPRYSAQSEVSTKLKSELSSEFRHMTGKSVTASDVQFLKRKPESLPESESVGPNKQMKAENGHVTLAASGVGFVVQPPPVVNDQELESIMDVDVFPEGVESVDRKGGIGTDAHMESEEAKERESYQKEEKKKEGSRSDNFAQGETADDGEKQSFVGSLGDDLKAQLNHLRTSLHSEGSVSSSDLEGCSDVFVLLGTCTPLQLCEVCDHLNIDSVVMGALPAIYQCIAPLSDRFGFKSTAIVAERLFLKKIIALTQTAPRVLTTSLTDFTKTFPKPTIEGVLIPSFVGQGSTTFQVDLVSKVTKEAFSGDLKSLFLRNVLSHPNFVWSESFSGFVQGLVDAKLELDPSLLSLLTASLAQNAKSQAQCKKFGKILLATINKYNKQLTHDHVTDLQRSVEVNQTFLKKACQNALKKIKI